MASASKTPKTVQEVAIDEIVEMNFERAIEAGIEEHNANIASAAAGWNSENAH